MTFHLIEQVSTVGIGMNVSVANAIEFSFEIKVICSRECFLKATLAAWRSNGEQGEFTAGRLSSTISQTFYNVGHSPSKAEKNTEVGC